MKLRIVKLLGLIYSKIINKISKSNVNYGNNKVILHKAYGKSIYNPKKTPGLKIVIKGENNIVEIGHNCRFDETGLSINIEGRNSVVKIHPNCKFSNSSLAVGDLNYVEIGNNANILKLRIPYKMSKGNKLVIGNDFCCNGVDIFLHDEKYNSVEIGKDCLFSFDIVVWPSDGHSIYDISTKQILNKPQNGIKIGNHCWVGRSVSILKGVELKDNTVCGASSVVNKSFNESNIVVAGIPAKCKRSGVNWHFDNSDNITSDELKLITDKTTER